MTKTWTEKFGAAAYWVYGHWFTTDEWADAKLTADKLGKPVKLALGGVPVGIQVYAPATAGNGTWA